MSNLTLIYYYRLKTDSRSPIRGQIVTSVFYRKFSMFSKKKKKKKKLVNWLIFKNWSVFQWFSWPYSFFILFISIIRSRWVLENQKWKTQLSVVVQSSKFIKYHRKACSLKPAKNLGSGIIRWPDEIFYRPDF